MLILGDLHIGWESSLKEQGMHIPSQTPRLFEKIKNEPQSDPFGIVEFERLRKGIDPAKVNVGQATRDMVFRAFKEYFMNDGVEAMSKCWEVAAGMG